MPLLPSSIYSAVARHPSRTIPHPLAARDATITIYKTVPGVYGNDSHGAKPGVVAGIVIGVACAFLIVICSIYCWVNREYAAEARAAAAASTKKKSCDISRSASVMSMPAPLGLHTSTRGSAAAAAAHARSGGHLPLRGSSQRHRRSASQTRTNARKPSRLSHDSLRFSSSASMSRKRSQSHHTQSRSHASSYTIPRPFIIASETSESTDSTSSDIVVQQRERQRRSLTRKPVPRRTTDLVLHRGERDDGYGQTQNQNQSQSPDEDDDDSDDEVIVIEELPKASSSHRSRPGRSRRSPSRQSEYSSVSAGPEEYEARASAGGRRRRSRG
ncbi:hypothetical protein CFIMG_008344RA00001 [Ceratocystis fimbriata CBS 114723]|uniref:Uncharacterized protein n=1 Tax=Ceratocystis fimbriata CBS 114723 TaxID=1035309 RepID=A0A2C5X4D9_9PEZI|nr:hypothetical protein CFIMG_008344RA00001 [Ceratocystis fimbriata CBS 114723]